MVGKKTLAMRSSAIALLMAKTDAATSQEQMLLGDRVLSNHPTPTVFCGSQIASKSLVAPLDSSRIRLINWNIQKSSQQGWHSDFEQLSLGRDLVLIQEASLHERFLAAPSKAAFWSFAPGYKDTGVMTFSSAQPSMHCSLLSWEPWLRTPKATNITEFALTDSEETLMVVNIHAVNFTLGIEAFARQIRMAYDIIEHHQGPIIFSGDFNTWRPERYQLLDTMLSQLGMNALGFEIDQRKRVFGQYLDHIYVRDLDVVEAASLHVVSSDHNPMTVTLSLR